MHRLHPLTDLFHSEETDLPFVRCQDCGGALEDCEDGHVIQKSVCRGETVMEAAICADCHEKLQASYSTESREALWNFYLDNADLPGRLKRFAALPVGDPALWLNACSTCGALRNNSEEYAMAAQCLGGDLVYGETPMMVCGSCMEKLVELLSEETRENYDRWMDRICPPDPTISNDTPRMRVLV